MHNRRAATNNAHHEVLARGTLNLQDDYTTPSTRNALHLNMSWWIQHSLEDAKTDRNTQRNPIKINLIPYNENPDREIERPLLNKKLSKLIGQSRLHCSIRTTEVSTSQQRADNGGFSNHQTTYIGRQHDTKNWNHRRLGLYKIEHEIVETDKHLKRHKTIRQPFSPDQKYKMKESTLNFFGTSRGEPSFNPSVPYRANILV